MDERPNYQKTVRQCARFSGCVGVDGFQAEPPVNSATAGTQQTELQLGFLSHPNSVLQRIGQEQVVEVVTNFKIGRGERSTQPKQPGNGR